MARLAMASLKDGGTAKRPDNELVGTDGTGACPYGEWGIDRGWLIRDRVRPSSKKSPDSETCFRLSDDGLTADRQLLFCLIFVCSSFYISLSFAEWDLSSNFGRAFA